MAFSLNKAAVKRSFSMAAETYDRWGEPQRRIGRRLDRLLPTSRSIRRILELGCGTGIMTALLQRRYPSATILAIDIAPGMIEFCRQKDRGGEAIRYEVGDAETLRSDPPFDLVVGSCCGQWFTDRAKAMRNIRRLTADDGWVALALLVSGTLAELAESYRAVSGTDMPEAGLWDEEQYRGLLNEAGFQPLATRTETIRILYESPWQVLQSLKYTGATFKHQPWFAPLSVSQLRRLVEFYQCQFSQDGGARVPASFHVLYVTAEPR